MYELKSKQGEHLTSLNLRNDSVVLWTNEINDDKFSAIPLLARGKWLFCRFPEKLAFLGFCRWPGMTIWPQLCNSHMREVPNPEEQLLLVDTVSFSWITSALQNQSFSNNSANSYFHLQSSAFMSPFHISFSKSRLFLYHFKHSQWCLSYLSTKLLVALVPSDMPQEPFHDTPQGEVTQLLQTHFFLSAPGLSYCYREQASHPQGWQNCCTVSARWPQMLQSGQWDTGRVMFKVINRQVTSLCSEGHHTHNGSRADIFMSEVTQSKSIAPRNMGIFITQLAL